MILHDIIILHSTQDKIEYRKVTEIRVYKIY